MNIYYRSYFRGWVEITPEQHTKLTQHMIKGITTMSGAVKQKYIESRFRIETKVHQLDIFMFN